jgi:hypothetical protein
MPFIVEMTRRVISTLVLDASHRRYDAIATQTQRDTSMSRSSPPWPKPKSPQEWLQLIFISPKSVLLAISIVGIIASFIAAPLVFLADFLWLFQLLRPWAQISALFWGVFLIALTITIEWSRFTRVLLLGAALLWSALIDSIDGQQDVLPMIVFALVMWGLIFASDTRAIIASDHRQSTLYWIGSIIGVVATGGYLGGAIYYFILNIVQEPLDYDRHPLYAFGILINVALRAIQRHLDTTKGAHDDTSGSA